MRSRGRSTASPRGAVAASFVATITVLLSQFAPVGAQSGSVHTSDQTAFGPLTASGNCSSGRTAEVAARTVADGLDDAWFTATGHDAVAVAMFPDADVGAIGNDYVLAVPGLDVTIEIAKCDITPTESRSTANSSFGTIDDPGGTDPSLLFGTSEQMQDCAPKPLSLVSTAEGGPLAGPTPYWNAVGFAADASTLDSVVFFFSEPLDDFGVWMGDLESRIDDATNPGDGGAAAVVKLYDAAGDVLAVTEVVPNDQRPVTADTAGPGTPGFDDDGFGCGDAEQNDDFSSCGNHGTRFVGFTWPSASVAAMQVVVGDDDHCVEVSLCEGLTEHLSFIGPSIGFDHPELSLTKTVVNDGTGVGVADDFVLTVTVDPDGAAERTEHASGELVELRAGLVHEIGEVPNEGYDLRSIECLDGDGVDLGRRFVPANDQVIRCEIVNDDLGTTTTSTSTTSTTVAESTTTTSATVVEPATSTSSTVVETTTSSTPIDPTTTTAVTSTTSTSMVEATAPSSTAPSTTVPTTTEAIEPEPTVRSDAASGGGTTADEPGGDDQPGLPATGRSSAPTLLAGAALLGAGVVAISTSRRRLD